MSSNRIFPPLTSTPFNFERAPDPVVEKPGSILPATPIEEVVLKPMKAPPTDKDAEAAVRTILEWMGEDAERDGLKETPARVVRGWKEFFKGYKEDPRRHLAKSFANTEGYNEMVCLQNIRIESYCEHHLVPFTGTAYVAYIPNVRIAGLSKLARVVEGYGKRLQIQEKLTRQIAMALQDELQPKGVAVAIRSEHQCMSTRGVHMPGADVFTMATFGLFETDPVKRAEFLAIVNR